MSLRPIETDGKLDTPLNKKTPRSMPYAPKKPPSRKPESSLDGEYMEQDTPPDEDFFPSVAPKTTLDDPFLDAAIEVDIERALKNVSAKVELYTSTLISSDGLADFLIDVANFQGEFMQDIGVITPEELRFLQEKLSIYRSLPVPPEESLVSMDTGARIFEKLDARKRYEGNEQLGDATSLRNYKGALYEFLRTRWVFKLVGPLSAIVVSTLGVASRPFGRWMDRFGIPQFMNPFARQMRLLEQRDEADRFWRDAPRWKARYHAYVKGYDYVQAGRTARLAYNPQTEADLIRADMAEFNAGWAAGAVAISTLAITGSLWYYHSKYIWTKQAKVTIKAGKDVYDMVIPAFRIQASWMKRWGADGRQWEERLTQLETRANDTFQQLDRSEDELREQAEEVENLMQDLQKLAEDMQRAGWDETLDKFAIDGAFNDYRSVLANVKRILDTVETFKRTISDDAAIQPVLIDTLYNDFIDQVENIRCKLRSSQDTKDKLKAATSALRGLEATLARTDFANMRTKLDLWKDERRQFLRLGGQLPPRQPCPVIEASMVDSVVDAYLAKRMAAQASVSGASD